MNNKAKILVVDDQLAVAMTIVFLLTRAGYDTEAALSSTKALQLAETSAFNLITLDVDMPCVDGFELFKRLKEIPHLKETPVLFISGNVTIENQQRAFDLGAVDFIEKPFGAQDFTSRILSSLKPVACH
jgi:CheY-like chemotaxis protein